MLVRSSWFVDMLVLDLRVRLVVRNVFSVKGIRVIKRARIIVIFVM